MANFTTIDKCTLHQNTALYSGNGTGTNAVTGLGFQPDLVWIKRRNSGTDHQVHDSVRGKSGSNYQYIQSNNTSAQSVQGDSDGINTFGADGFTAGYSNSAAWNESGGTFVGWCWKAGNSAGSSNTDGTITSTVSANTTAKFSVIKYQGNGTGNTTIGHGLGATPKFMIIKNLGATDVWGTLTGSYTSAAAPRVLYLDTTAASSNDTNVWGTSAVQNSTTFTVGDWSGSNTNGNNYIVYAWAELPGYSKFGTYFGNGNADGAFQYLGFRPAWVVIKRITATDHWVLFDNKRGYNGDNELLLPSDSRAEEDGASYGIDLVSNGFKCRTTDGWTNSTGQEYAYMAFGQTIVGTNNTPATAR